MFDLGQAVLPAFSRLPCPIAYKQYSTCILVSYPNEDYKDLMLLQASDSSLVVLEGFLRDEPRAKAVVVLADEDEPNFHTV